MFKKNLLKERKFLEINLKNLIKNGKQGAIYDGAVLPEAIYSRARHYAPLEIELRAAAAIYNKQVGLVCFYLATRCTCNRVVRAGTLKSQVCIGVLPHHDNAFVARIQVYVATILPQAGVQLAVYIDLLAHRHIRYTGALAVAATGNKEQQSQ